MPRTQMEVIEIVKKWVEIAGKNIESGDRMEKSYPGRLDGKYGWFIMSDKKLMFIQEEGFLRKHYELILDLPYEKIRKISHKGNYELDFIDVDGIKHDFKIYEINIKHVEKNLKELSHMPH
jgi:hypothetical protein